MRKVLLALFALASFALTTHAEFSADGLVEHRHLEMNGATIELAIFSPKSVQLRVIDDAQANSSLAAQMQLTGAAAGVNGGYFDPDYKTVGLLVSDGRVLAPLQKAKLLSGVVCLTSDRLQILRTAAFSLRSKPSAARQCGPFLVERGRAIPGLNNTRSARRTFVVTMTNGRAALGFSSPVTLAQLATSLSAPELGVQNALNMDGGSSSGFWFKGASGVNYIAERKTVRDYLALVPR